VKEALRQTARRSAESSGDLRLAERVERAVRATGYPPLRAIEVAACERLIILRGQVPTFYMKQMAQAAAVAVPGVHELRNDQVVTPAARPRDRPLTIAAVHSPPATERGWS
jgi:osmotically-inducible protein OsmY